MQKIIRLLLIVFVVGAIAFLGYRALNTKEERTAGEKMGAAVDAIGDGMNKAGRELEDRTLGEKLGDAVKDVGDDIKDKSNP